MQGKCVDSLTTVLTADYHFLQKEQKHFLPGLQRGYYLIVVITGHSEFASIQVERLFKLVHDTALPRPGIVGIVILHPEGRGVFLPVWWAIYTTAVFLPEDKRHMLSLWPIPKPSMSQPGDIEKVLENIPYLTLLNYFWTGAQGCPKLPKCLYVY